jgi:L-fucose isomerase-like protein
VSVDADPYALIEKYENNHVHGVPGNYLGELEKFCQLTGIEFLSL